MPVVSVLGSTISYRETGSGKPMVFLHGNPTSSYLWRGVLAAMDGTGRLLAPDLIGMGESGKLAIAYRLADHARYLDAWFDALRLDDVIVVGHDWGAVLAFDWAARHPDRVRGLAFLETIVRAMSWRDLPDSAQPVFRSLRTTGVGEAMVLDQNMFIEQALPATVATGLAEEDLAAYRQPYPTPESRRPLLQWPREMPIDGEPADVVERVEAYDRWLATSFDVPKLLLTFQPGPGTMVGPAIVDWCTANIANLQVKQCGFAGHHAPEDQPEQIGATLAGWATRLAPAQRS